MLNKQSYTTWNTHYSVTKHERQKLNKHKSFVLWLTGLPASGKSTLSNTLECKLYEMGIHTYVLDGDIVRAGLCKDLCFSIKDRRENVRRIAEVARLLVDAGIVVITAIISPYRDEREAARKMFNPGDFIEIYVKCPLHECERRDPKGLYRKARTGEIHGFTGITAPYEVPSNPDITIDTSKSPAEKSVEQLIKQIETNYSFF